MKFNKKSLKFAISMAAAFTVLAVCARVTDNALPAAADVSDKPVIVLDAGHGAYVLTIVLFTVISSSLL